MQRSTGQDENVLMELRADWIRVNYSHRKKGGLLEFSCSQGMAETNRTRAETQPEKSDICLS
jgi:hypothetical protein